MITDRTSELTKVSIRITCSFERTLLRVYEVSVFGFVCFGQCGFDAPDEPRPEDWNG